MFLVLARTWLKPQIYRIICQNASACSKHTSCTCYVMTCTIDVQGRGSGLCEHFSARKDAHWPMSLNCLCSFQACAPRYYWRTEHDTPFADVTGTCYLSVDSLKTFVEYAPCRTGIVNALWANVHRIGSCIIVNRRQKNTATTKLIRLRCKQTYLNARLSSNSYNQIGFFEKAYVVYHIIL